MPKPAPLLTMKVRRSENSEKGFSPAKVSKDFRENAEAGTPSHDEGAPLGE